MALVTDDPRLIHERDELQRELDAAKAEMEQRSIRSGRTYDAFVALKAENERLIAARDKARQIVLNLGDCCEHDLYGDNEHDDDCVASELLKALTDKAQRDSE